MLKKMIWALAPLFLVACVTTPAPVRTGPTEDPAIAGVTEENGLTVTQADLPTAPPPPASFIPDERIKICTGLRVQNAPINDRAGYVLEYDRLVVALGRIVLAPVPLNGGCISSGYGQRNGRLHKGIDISAPRGTWVYAAAPGIVLEAGWGGGYGNYVLIDHGLGLITRYAHLDAFAEGLAVDSEVGFGWPVGQVGNTANRRVGVHLHFEVLTGNYNNPRKSFGLQGNDPLAFPVYETPPIS
jgi:murein DD-endopeptidase MepM/ murein hydrolase activator NlpD